MAICNDGKLNWQTRRQRRKHSDIILIIKCKYEPLSESDVIKILYSKRTKYGMNVYDIGIQYFVLTT